jgi:hypothetical protein
VSFVGDGDAFRVAAREVFFINPGSRDCLWYTIQRVDLMAHLKKYVDYAEIVIKLLEVESLLTPYLVERFRDIHHSVLRMW